MQISNKLPDYTPPLRKTEQEIAFTVADSSRTPRATGEVPTGHIETPEEFSKRQFDSSRSFWSRTKAIEPSRTIGQEWDKLVEKINRERPHILRHDFDFTMTNGQLGALSESLNKDEDYASISPKGKLTVVSDKLSKDDKAWLEQQLNDNDILRHAVTQYSLAIIDGYDHKYGGHMGGRLNNRFASSENIYKDVAKQLDSGAIKFRALLNDIKAYSKYGEAMMEQPYVKGKPIIIKIDGFSESLALAVKQLQPHIDTTA
ncbi:hypothetical protein [Chitinilyticum litopenaei]|uniref:hypothetical protein n=1 Tax=Chitinilyticum litopenaei TaxID=1121276 RepID=UPI00048D3347|nr:hypothetical protein [Chitinilyticum litopenaei]